MVQFGRTLQEVVKSDWRCHAVAYWELKRALVEAHADGSAQVAPWPSGAGTPSNAPLLGGDVGPYLDPAADGAKGETGTSVCIAPPHSVSNFFQIYNDSIDRVTAFYEDMVKWARDEKMALETAVVGNLILGDYIAKADHAKDEASTLANAKEGRPAHAHLTLTDFLIQKIIDFSRELDQVLEFLLLNSTAFYKIMKKFDKRTGYHLREAKLEELRQQHPYLYDGGDIRECRKNCLEWIPPLQSVSCQGSKVGGIRLQGRNGRANGGGCVGLSVKNSLIQVNGGEVLALLKGQDQGAIGACTNEHQQLIPKLPCNTMDRVGVELCSQQANSLFFDQNVKADPPPSFMNSEVSIDFGAGMLGQGEFCTVYELNGFNLASYPDGNECERTMRCFMRDHCLRDGEARYAIKRISSDTVGQDVVTDAAVDLAREQRFLAALRHPNIIRLRGTINVPGHPNYSLILDRLYDTLAARIEKWKVGMKRARGKFDLIGNNKLLLDDLWTDRLVAAYDVASAMAYLHSHKILHRDIKPDNIGFDIRGDLKIFDFGLAKELKPSEQEGVDQYRTSGVTGTRRYIAPEVVRVKPYGLSADVFSFGILMWEMLSLRAPFEGMTREQHYKQVVVEGKRPKISKHWSAVTKELVQRCWHETPLERPSFEGVCELIKFSLPIGNKHANERSDELLLRSDRSNIVHGCDTLAMKSNHMNDI